MLVEEIIQRIQSLYSKGVQSDDSRLSSRHIYNKLLTVRSRLISQEAKKKQKVSQWNYQTISCVELIKVPAHECPCIPPVGCDILRSKYKLPKPLSDLSGSLIQSVTTIDRLTKINPISINAIKSLAGNKYSKKDLAYFIEDGFLYISTPTKLQVLRLVGLFEDPVSVKNFETFCDTCKECEDCLDYQKEEFPIDNDMVDVLVQLAVEELIVMFSQSVQDLTNNSADDIANIRMK